jgi:16S rRNA (cytidine1402-2'-O)-methyltransferase
LNHLGIRNRLISYHEHNESERAEELGTQLAAGSSIALVSDAGTPAINDPGLRLVQKAYEIGSRVVPIPGPVAFINAVIASGLPTDSIFFGGFLPSRKAERVKRLNEVRSIPATLVFYDSPHRVTRSLADCLSVLGDRKAAIARELTKLHEEIVRGTVSELHSRFSSANSRGELVLIIDRARAEVHDIGSRNESSLIERINEFEAEGMDRMTALKRAAREFGISKSEAYRLLQARSHS